MTSLTGSCPVRPPLTNTRMPSSGRIIHRLGRSPPVEASGALKLSSCEEEYVVSRSLPRFSSNELVKKFTSFHRALEDSGFTQYWSDRLSPSDLFSNSTVDRMPMESNTLRMPSRVDGMAR